MPSECLSLLKENADGIPSIDILSNLLHYKLIQENKNGYTKYLDVTEVFSNRILSNLESYQDFDSFCMLLKSKDIAYSRVSRNLIHILLNITSSNMAEYKDDSYTFCFESSHQCKEHVYFFVIK